MSRAAAAAGGPAPPPPVSPSSGQPRSPLAAAVSPASRAPGTGGASGRRVSVSTFLKIQLNLIHTNLSLERDVKQCTTELINL